MVTPYYDSADCRLFLAWAPSESFVWHRDEEDRKIKVLDGDGWCFQFQDCLPFVLKRGSEFNIKAYEYHRLIKGKNDLLVRITRTNK